jgi:hypothetical protein
MGHQKSTRTPGLVLDLTGRPGHETNQTTGEALEHAEHNHIYNKIQINRNTSKYTDLNIFKNI